jgi:isocitrate dehydrogenase (NAD+)
LRRNQRTAGRRHGAARRGEEADTHRATLIPGDGIGPEIVEATRRVLDATGVEIAWDVVDAGDPDERAGDTQVPDAVLEAIRGTGVALKGPLATPDDAAANANVALRTALGLFAGVRPCRSYPGVASRWTGVDVVIVRELTEAEYTGVEFEHGEPDTGELIDFIDTSTGRRVREDSGVSIRTISERASERIVRFAFERARSSGRHLVTAAHKANIMKFTDGLFLETARRVATAFPDIAFQDRIIDALTMQLVQRPEAFDVLVLPNLYGDIVAEVCAGLVGGPDFVPAANHGDGIAVFETLHGTVHDRAGTGRANPVAMIVAGAMLLEHLGEHAAAERVHRAVEATIAEVTGGAERGDERALGDATTTSFADAVSSRVGSDGVDGRRTTPG